MAYGNVHHLRFPYMWNISENSDIFDISKAHNGKTTCAVRLSIFKKKIKEKYFNCTKYLKKENAKPYEKHKITKKSHYVQHWP